MKNRLSAWLLIAIVFVAVPFWWLLIDADTGVAPSKPLDIAELRKLAAILPGPRPTAVTDTVLATRNTVGDFYAAGTGLKLRPLAIITWILPVPGADPIIINPGAPPTEAGLGQFANFDHAAQGPTESLAKTASLVLFTQGHQSELPRAANHLGKAGMGMASPARKPAAQPLSYTSAQAVAPGVVVIPASSHAPGARLIFVKLADGREFLFVGDLATFRENWVRLRARSHLAAVWGPAQDRSETYAWLRTIRALKDEAPTLKIVPGNDYDWLGRQVAKGIVSEWRADSGFPAKAP